MRVLFLYCTIILSGCGAASSDYLLGLGEGYTLRVEGTGADLIYYSFDDKHFFDLIIIYPQVSNFDNNKDYIIAKQELSREYYKDYAPWVLSPVANAFYAIDSDSVEATYEDSFYVQHFAADSDFYRKRIIPNLTITKTNDSYYLRDTIYYLEYIADSLLKNDPSLNYYNTKGLVYWIIDKKKIETLGPYDYQELADEMKRLGIDKKLEIPD